MAFPLKSRNSSGRNISILCEEPDSGVPEPGLSPRESLPELLHRETLLEPQFRESLPPRGALPEPHFRESFSNPFHGSSSSGVRFLDPFSEYRPRESLPPLQFRESPTELQPRELLPPLQFRESSTEPQARELLTTLPFRGPPTEPHLRELPSELYSVEPSFEGQAQAPPSHPLSRGSGSRESRPRSRNPYSSATNRYHPYRDDAAVARRHRGSLSSQQSPPRTPRTPGLFRSDSYDSNHTNDPVSPVTPRESFDYGYSTGIHGSFNSMNGSTSVYPDPTQFEHGTRPTPFESYSKSSSSPLPQYPVLSSIHRRNVYEDSALAEFYVSRNTSQFSPPPATPVMQDGGLKRYCCRYAKVIGCPKTFTTSGHASRHSKIHTDEKGIQCLFASCGKKFTRADNMKQHLETHYKETKRGSGPGSRSGGASGMGSSGRGSMSQTAGIRKNLTGSRASAQIRDSKAAARGGTKRGGRHELAHLEPYGSAQTWAPVHPSPLASPMSDTDQTLDMEVRTQPIKGNRQIARSGLDTLAAAVASQVEEKAEKNADAEMTAKSKGKSLRTELPKGPNL